MDWRSALTSTAWNLAFIVAIVVPLLLCVAYLTLWERKLIGWIQIRIGPNRVGPAGLLQPVADGVKLLMKEIILRPTRTRPVPARAGADADSGARRVGGDSLCSRSGAGGHQRRAAVHPGVELDGRVTA